MTSKEPLRIINVCENPGFDVTVEYNELRAALVEKGLIKGGV